jgi:hypothetical protein
MKFTDRDFMGIEVFERLDEEFVALSARLGVDVLRLNLAAGVATIPCFEYINIIERNLDRLSAAVPDVDIAPTKTWLGEDKDEAWLDYKDVNRWFESLNKLSMNIFRAC